MYGAMELDRCNTYVPDLNDIKESAERTYGEANSFFRKEELYLKEIESLIKIGEIKSERQIYDECHAIASDLAKCCEMYLKALFLYENKDSNYTCDELWKILEAKGKKDKNRKDENGNVIYYQTENDNETPLRYPDRTIIYVYAKVDKDGNLICDTNGNPIYVDKFGKEYEYSRKGRAVRTNGHALDRLVDLLSPELKLFLETRMLTIPMGTTEENKTVSILDIMQKNGIIFTDQHISYEQYSGWLDQHKRTFEEARFSGQKRSDVSVEFMYHLATQIKAVAQYKIEPKQEQQFTITQEELLKLPVEIRQLVSFHSSLISEPLIKLIISDANIRNKIVKLFSKPYAVYDKISHSSFYDMIKIFEVEEINYISYICYMVENFSLNKKENSNDVKLYFGSEISISNFLHFMGLSAKEIIDFCIQVKTGLKVNIGPEIFVLLKYVYFNRYIRKEEYKKYKLSDSAMSDESFEKSLSSDYIIISSDDVVGKRASLR